MPDPSHKERTRARILDEAAAAMRASGYEGIGVAALMKRAGLAHGGFYAHFESRDDLVAHAVERMFQDSAALLKRYLSDEADPAAGLTGLIDYYLSEKARASVDSGCPLPSLAGEAARMPEAARARFEAGMTYFAAAIERALRRLGRPQPELLAQSALAEMVGAMALARATTDRARSDAILSGSRTALKQRLGLEDRRNPAGPRRRRRTNVTDLSPIDRSPA